MDVDSMVLEDVELEPELPPPPSGGSEASQHVHVATRIKDDSVSVNPACLRFQTTARTGAPNAVWLNPANPTASSASGNSEQKHSQLRETFSAVRMQRASPNAGSARRSSASESSSTGSPSCRKHSTSLHASLASFCLQGRKRTAASPPLAESGTIWKQALPPPPNPSLARDRALGFLTFLLCGATSLSCWQFLISLMPYLENTFFGGTPVGNSLMGVYQVGCIFVQLVFMFLFESMRPWVIIAAIVFDAGLALLFPLVVTNGSHRTRMALTHMVALLFGVNAGIICGCCLAVASALPYNFIGAFSAGQGIAGIISFITGLAFSEVFDLGCASGLTPMLWMVYGISCGISLVSGGLLLVALRQPWASRHLVRYWEAQQLRSSTRRWTVMWQRWVGRPQNVRCSQVGAAGNSGAMELSAADSALGKGGGCATAHTDQSEDACAQVDFGTAGRQLGMSRRPSASKSAVTTAAAATASTPVMNAGTGAENEGRIQGPMSGKQPLRSNDTAPDAVAWSTSTEDVAALAGLQDMKTHHVPSGDSEAVTSCRSGESLEEPTNEGGAKGIPQENVSKEPRGGVRISLRSEDATFCEQGSVPTEEEKLQPSRGWRYMLRDSGIYLFCVFFNFFVTLNLYPRVGPIMWHYSSFSKNGSQYIILFGVFCLGDFFGKCMMDISKTTRLLSWFRIRQKLLLPVVVSRLGIAVFFLLGAYMNSHWFFNSFALYVVIMLLLAITNGWCATTSLVYVCTSVERLEEREILGPASVLVLKLGLMAGAWTALAYPSS